MRYYYQRTYVFLFHHPLYTILQRLDSRRSTLARASFHIFSGVFRPILVPPPLLAAARATLRLRAWVATVARIGRRATSPPQADDTSPRTWSNWSSLRRRLWLLLFCSYRIKTVSVACVSVRHWIYIQGEVALESWRFCWVLCTRPRQQQQHMKLGVVRVFLNVTAVIYSFFAQCPLTYETWGGSPDSCFVEDHEK